MSTVAYVHPSNCPICRGQGLISLNPLALVNQPGFGKIVPCPAYPIYYRLGKEGTGIEQDDYEDLAWQNILTRKDSGLAEAKVAIQNVLQRGYGMVYIWGGYGNAKTLLLKVATITALRKQTPALYLNAFDMLDAVRATFGKPRNEAENELAVLKMFQTVPVLCLDEMELTTGTEWAGLKRFAVLDARYDDAIHQRPSITIMAGNVPPQALEPKLADRLSDGRFSIIEIKADSARRYMHYPDERTASVEP